MAFISMLRPEITWLLCGGRTRFFLLAWSNWTRFFFWALQLSWCQCRRSDSSWFRCMHRKWLGICAELWTDLVSVSGSKSCFFVSGQWRWLELRAGVEIDLTSVMAMMAWKFQNFVQGIEFHYVFVLVVEINFISEWGISLKFISGQGSALTWILRRDRKRLGLTLWIEMD